MNTLWDNSIPKIKIKRSRINRKFQGKATVRMRRLKKGLLKWRMENKKRKELATQRGANLVAQKENNPSTNENLILKEQEGNVLENGKKLETIMPDKPVIRPSGDKLMSHEQMTSNITRIKQEIDSDLDDGESTDSILKKDVLNKQTKAMLSQHKEVVPETSAVKSSSTPETASKDDDAILPFSNTQYQSTNTQSTNTITNQNSGSSQTILNECTHPSAVSVVSSAVRVATTAERAAGQDATTQVCVHTRNVATQVSLYDINSNQDDRLNHYSEDRYEKIKTKRSLTTRERRIVDLVYFFNELKCANSHGSRTGCSLNSIVIDGEKRVGLFSRYSLKCMRCNFKKNIRSESSPKMRTLNTDFVSAMLNIQCTFATMNALLEEMCLPTLTFGQYLKECNKISRKKASEASKNAPKNVKKKPPKIIYQKYIPYVPKKRKKNKQVNLSDFLMQEFKIKEENVFENEYETILPDISIKEDQFEIEEENVFENESETILPDLPIMNTSVNKMIIDQGHTASNTIKIKYEIDDDFNDEALCSEIFGKGIILNHEPNIIGGENICLLPSQHLSKSNRKSSTMITQNMSPNIAAESQQGNIGASFVAPQDTGESSRASMHFSSFVNSFSTPSINTLSDIMEATYMPAGPAAVQLSPSLSDVSQNASKSSYMSLLPATISKQTNFDNNGTPVNTEPSRWIGRANMNSNPSFTLPGGAPKGVSDLVPIKPDKDKSNQGYKRSQFHCDDCDTDFMKCKSWNYHKKSYCIKRLKLSPSCTVTRCMLKNNPSELTHVNHINQATQPYFKELLSAIAEKQPP